MEVVDSITGLKRARNAESSPAESKAAAEVVESDVEADSGDGDDSPQVAETPQSASDEEDASISDEDMKDDASDGQDKGEGEDEESGDVDVDAEENEEVSEKVVEQEEPRSGGSAQQQESKQGENEAEDEDDGSLDEASGPVGEPVLDAKDSRLHECFSGFFESSGFSEPSVIQQYAWPLIEAGRDVLGIAPTGSGKTLSYLLPALAHVLRKARNSPNLPRRPVVLVVVPTRELALQVCTTAKKMRRKYGVIALPAYGGKDRNDQVSLLSEGEGVGILIVTPGRLLDLVGTQDVTLERVTLLILDEADKMLEMGFDQQIGDIVALLREKDSESLRTQNVLLSATFPRKLRAIATKLRLFKTQPATVHVQTGGKECRTRSGIPRVTKEDENSEKNLDGASYAAAISSTIKQIVQVCAEHKKPRKLLKFLEKVRGEDSAEKRRNTSSVLIFCSKIKTVNFVFDFLKRQKVPHCAHLHGSLDQRIRERTLSQFKAGKVKILVATDVAGRGIDIKGLPFVVNYDFPSTLKMYAHRIGRTGRQDRHGTAMSFFTRNFAGLAPDLVNLLRTMNQKVDPFLLELVKDGSVEDLPETKSQKRRRKRAKTSNPKPE